MNWPSKDIFDEDVPLEKYEPAELKFRDIMLESVEKVEQKYHLEVLDDRLKR